MRAAFAAAVAAVWSALARVDLRGWFTLALLALVWRIIEIIAARPSLLDNASFMQLVTPICGAGGLLLIASFLYASSKGDADKSAALANNAATMREAGIPVGSAERQKVRDVEMTAETVTLKEDPAP